MGESNAACWPITDRFFQSSTFSLFFVFTPSEQDIRKTKTHFSIILDFIGKIVLTGYTKGEKFQDLIYPYVRLPKRDRPFLLWGIEGG